MAKRDKQPEKRIVRGTLRPVRGTLAHGHNNEVREAVGFEGRAISALDSIDLVELSTTYLLEGPDQVRQRYGLTLGELVALVQESTFANVVTLMAQAQRAQAVLRCAVSIPRLVAMLEDKLREPDVNPLVVMEGLKTIKEIMVEVGGIEQKLSISHNFGSGIQNAGHGAAPMGGDDLRKVQRLHASLEALASAGVDLGAPEAKTILIEKLDDSKRAAG